MFDIITLINSTVIFVTAMLMAHLKDIKLYLLEIITDFYFDDYIKKIIF